jgi:hypothetical protein
MNIPVFLCILLILFQSCSLSQENLVTGEQLLNVPSKPSEVGYFKNHFEIAEVIPIQTTDTFLISDIKKLIRYKDLIYLLSGKNNTVFIINKNGNIENCIHKPGIGPGESRMILDIAFDDISKQIVIYNDYSKLLFFDLQGRFQYEINVDGLYEGINSYNGKLIFYNKLEGYTCYPYKFKIFNIKDKTWKEAGRDEKLDFPIRSQGRQLVKSKHMWFTAPLDFNLFTYKEDQIQIPYELKISKSKLDENLIEKSISNPPQFFDAVMDNKLIYSINSIRETTDFLVFRSNQEGFFVINKRDNKVYWDKFVEEKALEMNLTFYCPHEGDDNKIMFILEADAHMQSPNASLSDNIYIQKLKKEDNPVLIFYKQKENKESDK